MDLDDAAKQHTMASIPVATPMATGMQHTEPRNSDLVPIASLTPLQPVPRAASLRAVVALIYPYSSATDTLALLLTEPDFRLRLRRGQVRVQFKGPAARAVARARVGIGDAVTLNLRGGKWVENSGVGTPGRGVEGELVFKNFVQVEITRDGETFATVELDEPEELSEDVEVIGTDVVAPTPMSGRVGTTADQNAEHASPAFLRGRRVASGGFSVAAVDPFLDVDSRGDGVTPGKRRKAWRFVEHSQSPEGDEAQTPQAGEKSSPVVIIDDEDEGDRSQRMAPTTPTPAPAVSRREAMAPLVTTNLVPEPQLAPPLSTPIFRIPTTPPAPPTLRPVQSPALPMVSPFSSIPPPEGFSSSLPVPDRVGPVVDITEQVGSQPTQSHDESQDYFGTAPQEQQPQESTQVSSFVDFGSQSTFAPASPDAGLRSTQDIIDLTEAPGTAKGPGVEETIATTPILPPLEDQFFDFVAAGQAPETERLDELVDLSPMQPPVEHPITPLAEEQRVQSSAQRDESTKTQETRVLPTEAFLPSPEREPTTMDDLVYQQEIPKIASQLPLEPTTQDTLQTSVPIPMLPTPGTSQSRLLEMISSSQTRRDTVENDQRHEQQEDLINRETDSTQLHPVTPTPNKRVSKSRVSDVPEVLSPWFSSRRSSRNKRIGELEADNIQPDVKTDKDQATLAERTPHELEQQLNKFASGLRTRLSYFTPLASLQPHLNTLSRHANTVDILALVSSDSSPPERAKGGPRDFYTSIHVADQTRMSNPVAIQILRPRNISLPTAIRGDVMLLRNFIVKSRKSECVLVSGEGSAWCVWRLEGNSGADSSQPDNMEQSGALSPDTEAVASTEECRGPPVEVEDEERMHVLALRHWWSANRDSVPDVVEQLKRSG